MCGLGERKRSKYERIVAASVAFTCWYMFDLTPQKNCKTAMRLVRDMWGIIYYKYLVLESRDETTNVNNKEFLSQKETNPRTKHIRFSC